MNGKTLLSIVICTIISILLISNTNNTRENDNFIKIKEVLNYDTVKNHDNYEYGRHQYPNYQREGLSESFLIKKQADITIFPEDISSVEISKQYPFKNIDAYWIKIYFSPSGEKKIKKYTVSKIDHKIAFEISNIIFLVATLIEPIENVVAMPMTNRSITELKRILKPIAQNITYVD